MSLVETVTSLLLTIQPFGGVTFDAVAQGADTVIVTLHTNPRTVLQFDQDLEFTVIEGETMTCEPEEGEVL